MQFVVAYLRDEEKLGRISPPYPKDILLEAIGPFCSSPLGVVPKSTQEGEPQKYRLITDASELDADKISINSQIDSDDFPTAWDGVDVVARKVSYI